MSIICSHIDEEIVSRWRVSGQLDLTREKWDGGVGRRVEYCIGKILTHEQHRIGVSTKHSCNLGFEIG
jgi:hypothetical protein